MTTTNLCLAQGLVYKLDPELDMIRSAGAYFRRFPRHRHTFSNACSLVVFRSGCVTALTFENFDQVSGFTESSGLDPLGRRRCAGKRLALGTGRWR